MPTPTPLLLFLGAVTAILLLTVGLGIFLAVGFITLSRELRSTVAPAQPAVALAGVTHRVAGPGAAVFALVTLIVGIFVGRYVRLTPPEASIRAGQVDLLFNTMLGIATSIFLLVEGILVYSAIRFRRKKGEEGDGLAIHGSNRLEFAWTVVPALIVLWLGAYSFQIFAQMRAVPEQAMTVEVVSRQFQWEFRYPDLEITSSDLYLPLDKPVQLQITSADVVHSFWVPAFRVKQDAIPMQETETFFTANTLGRYRVVCAELCGVGHARMGLTSYVIVQSQTEFDAWVAEQQALAGQPGDPVALFAKYGCNACHTLAAADATGLVGPDLDGIGTTAGTRVPGMSAEDYIRESILTPGALLSPQCPTGPCASPSVMPPDFGARMPQSQLDTLVRFLLEQK